MINKNNKLLVILESPNKVKTVYNILTNLGYTQVRVLASLGHITKIKDVRSSYKNTGIYPNENFKTTYAIIEDKHKTVEDLKFQMKWADLVLLATDPDREGEAISWHLKNTLKIPDNKYYRITYNSITKESIQFAMEHPTKINSQLFDAADARQIIDKLVGYSLSPIAKTYIGAKSVGRCQSAGLKLIVDREKEITEFVPESYYDLYVDFIKESISFRAKYIGTDDNKVDHIKNKADLAIIKYGCDSDFVIKDITKKDRYESPSPPFCTATFQQEAANKLGLKVKDAMSCAQKLFEGVDIDGEHKGLITYMRTDSTEFSKDFVTDLQKYIKANFGNKAFVTPRIGKKTGSEQEGHECLRVTDLAITPDKIKTILKNNLLISVYTMIWRRTVAAALPNAQYAETIYSIYNNEHKFIFSFADLIEAGFKEIYNYTEENTLEDSNNSKVLSKSFTKNEILQDTTLIEIETQTKPKARFKEASFIKELQKQEIGRPSTYASIVETVLSPTRNYCTLIDKYIVPTEKGIQLSNFLDRAFSDIININYTKEMEKDLDLVATNKLNKIDFLKTFFDKLETAINNNTEAVSDKPDQICPKCGSPMVIRRSRFGKLFYGCSTYPKCNGIINI